jgi:hypothetical protein
MLTVEELQKLADSPRRRNRRQRSTTRTSPQARARHVLISRTAISRTAVEHGGRDADEEPDHRDHACADDRGEHNSMARAELDRAAAELRAHAEAEHEARIAAMTPAERATHDYHAAHGEHDFAAHVAEHGDPIALLDAGIAAGLLADAGERDRLVAWRDRCAARKGT